jgi:hypothetical protein
LVLFSDSGIAAVGAFYFLNKEPMAHSTVMPAPISIATPKVLRRLNSDSELIVLSKQGVSSSQLIFIEKFKESLTFIEHSFLMQLLQLSSVSVLVEFSIKALLFLLL